jgi:hypothetical protein
MSPTPPPGSSTPRRELGAPAREEAEPVLGALSGGEDQPLRAGRNASCFVTRTISTFAIVRAAARKWGH